MREPKLGGARAWSVSTPTTPTSPRGVDAILIANMLPLNVLSDLEHRAQTAKAVGRREVAFGAVETLALVAEIRARRKRADKDERRRAELAELEIDMRHQAYMSETTAADERDKRHAAESEVERMKTLVEKQQAMTAAARTAQAEAHAETARVTQLLLETEARCAAADAAAESTKASLHSETTARRKAEGDIRVAREEADAARADAATNARRMRDELKDVKQEAGRRLEALEREMSLTRVTRARQQQMQPLHEPPPSHDGESGGRPPEEAQIGALHAQLDAMSAQLGRDPRDYIGGSRGRGISGLSSGFGISSTNSSTPSTLAAPRTTPGGGMSDDPLSRAGQRSTIEQARANETARMHETACGVMDAVEVGWERAQSHRRASELRFSELVRESEARVLHSQAAAAEQRVSSAADEVKRCLAFDFAR
jgi:hypothetical protein